MISDSYSSSYPNGGFHMYDALEEMLSSPTTRMATEAAVEGTMQSGLLFYNMSVLRDKVEELDSIVGVVMSTDQIRIKESSFSPAVAIASTLLQDVIVAASSLMLAFQQLGSGDDQGQGHVNVVGDYNQLPQQQPGGCGGGLMATKIVRDSNGDNSVIDALTTNSNNRTNYGKVEPNQEKTSDVTTQFHHNSSPSTATGTAAIDVIELEVADLLAKYTHYCQICGKGFKRDANLRMHMRAHGDEYKTNKALTNPMKFINQDQEQQQQQTSGLTSRKYSCPQEGCRWNKNHAKFQPLKSMVCVKNHYKRSHCPKMYVCNRCNRKQFSVLSDLRTHEKHCGDLRWQCSCGTSFSRKDKLMGHVALFVGHSPVVVPVTQKGA